MLRGVVAGRCWTFFAGFFSLSFLALPALLGQSAVSVRPGLIHLAEGDVVLRDVVEHKRNSGRYRHLLEGQRLISRDGRVELFLSQAMIVRVGANSEAEMVKADLNDIRLRLVKGAAIVEVLHKQGLDAITILSGEAQVRFDKKGLYRIDQVSDEPARLRVFRGSATVFAGPAPQGVPAKRSMLLAALPEGARVEKLDRSGKDALDDWQRERARVLAQDRQPGFGNQQTAAEGDLFRSIYRGERDGARGSPGRGTPSASTSRGAGQQAGRTAGGQGRR